jgi:hypothetical protein
MNIIPDQLRVIQDHLNILIQIIDTRAYFFINSSLNNFMLHSVYIDRWCVDITIEPNHWKKADGSDGAQEMIFRNSQKNAFFLAVIFLAFSIWQPQEMA